jgi:hypothetical protein
MKAAYLPTTRAGKLIHVMEESAEVIREIAKIQRFGLDNTNPDSPKKETNRQALLREMHDLKFAISRLEKVL